MLESGLTYALFRPQKYFEKLVEKFRLIDWHFKNFRDQGYLAVEKGLGLTFVPLAFVRELWISNRT